jgi:uncharacterized YigZ family protein
MAARTIRRRIEFEIAKRKGSRFITAAWPLESGGSSDGDGERRVEAQVKEMLEQRRVLYPTACHHCYAYTTMDGREYCSDDGEPHGTAGKPILVALQRAKLVDVCLVVSRIFGGTKLGTGGLIRAYSAAAQETLDQEAEIVTKVPMTTVRVVAPFAHIDAVKHGCTKFVADVVSQDYGAYATFFIRVPTAHTEDLVSFLQSRSSGAIAISYGDATERDRHGTKPTSHLR